MIQLVKIYLDGKNIGIVTTAQHIHDLNKIKNILKNENFHPIVSKGDRRISKIR